MEIVGARPARRAVPCTCRVASSSNMKLHFTGAPRGCSLSVDIPSVNPEDDFIDVFNTASSPKELSTLVENVYRGFRTGWIPQLCEECVGGTYFLCGEDGQKNGVFKPLDEEPYSWNNPKGFVAPPSVGPSHPGYKEGVLVGEATVRECAAFFLDHDHFANVPATDLVVAKHPAFHCARSGAWAPSLIGSGPDVTRRASSFKIGSFQEFREHDGDFEEMAPRDIACFPVPDVQKVATLDIRLFNTDRHGGNLLYKLGNSGVRSSTLIPIDHSYTLPSTIDEALFVWLNWPQVRCKIEDDVKAYIAQLNVERDIAILTEKFPGSFGDEHFWVMRLSTMLLQKGAAADLTLSEIATIMSRVVHNKASQLERLVAQCPAEPGQRPDIAAVGHLLDDLILSILASDDED